MQTSDNLRQRERTTEMHFHSGTMLSAIMLAGLTPPTSLNGSTLLNL